MMLSRNHTIQREEDPGSCAGSNVNRRKARDRRASNPIWTMNNKVL